jgi:two-component system, OmpR family, alkaline phosphatase synthesis response regulator PhoP
MTAKILVVEDEPALRIALSDRLKSEDYEVETAADGEEGFEKAMSGDFDLLLLDVMLPKKKGFDVCRDLRSAGLTMPIILLTARGETVDKVLGLKLGADDYVTKPFEMSELLARIEARLRVPRARTVDADGDIVEFGTIRIDFRGTTVSKNGETVPLSAREFQLLSYLVRHPGTTLSRETLLKEVWGYNSDSFTRTVDVHIANLRQKLEDNPKQPVRLITVLGLGYKFQS